MIKVEGPEALIENGIPYILHYKGRNKVESLNFLANSKEEAIHVSQKYCASKHLKWLTLSPFFADLTILDDVV